MNCRHETALGSQISDSRFQIERSLMTNWLQNIFNLHSAIHNLQSSLPWDSHIRGRSHAAA
jgi:hypothetical protein